MARSYAGRVSSDRESEPPLRLLLTKDEAALALAISSRQVERLVARGDLVPTRIGGAIRFTRAQLEALVENHTTRPATWPRWRPEPVRARRRGSRRAA